MLNSPWHRLREAVTEFLVHTWRWWSFKATGCKQLESKPHSWFYPFGPVPRQEGDGSLRPSWKWAAFSLCSQCIKARVAKVRVAGCFLPLDCSRRADKHGAVPQASWWWHCRATAEGSAAGTGSSEVSSRKSWQRPVDPGQEGLLHSPYCCLYNVTVLFEL